MTETNPTPASPGSKDQTNTRPKKRRVWLWLLVFGGLLFSLLLNIWLFGSLQQVLSPGSNIRESYVSGSRTAQKKIVIIRVEGAIMPPLTGRLLNQIEHAREDENVEGVLLTIDSPGGLVADSHQIYHELKKLGEGENKKPVFVAMKRLTASGGYYLAMGAGPDAKIFAEPTTWTGSIGVIIPRYDISGLADSWKVKSVPLKTGRFKDALSPFRELTPEERDVWTEILNESFANFLGVIEENRPQLSIRKTDNPTAADDPTVIPNRMELISEKVDEGEQKNLATGQIFTATSALKHGLVDEIAFEEEALEQLQEKLGLDEAKVVTYSTPKTLWETFLGFSRATDPEQQQQIWLDASVPRAMYYFSWVPPAVPLP